MNGLDALVDALGDATSLTGRPGVQATALIVLALVFAWSGAVKLRSPARAAFAIVDFRLARSVRPGLGAAVGAAEATLAVALFASAVPLGAAAAWSAAVAALLLWAFVALIATSLSRHDRFACFCFGGDEDISWRTLVRTSVLAALATLIAVAVAAVERAAVADANALALEATCAVALIGMLALLARVPNLVRWNGNAFAGYPRVVRGGDE